MACNLAPATNPASQSVEAKIKFEAKEEEEEAKNKINAKIIQSETWPHNIYI